MRRSPSGQHNSYGGTALERNGSNITDFTGVLGFEAPLEGAGLAGWNEIGQGDVACATERGPER